MPNSGLFILFTRPDFRLVGTGKLLVEAIPTPVILGLTLIPLYCQHCHHLDHKSSRPSPHSSIKTRHTIRSPEIGTFGTATTWYIEGKGRFMTSLNACSVRMSISVVIHLYSFMATLRMYSTRTIAARCVNAQGKLNAHEADGVMSLYGVSGGNAEPYVDVFPVCVGV